MQIHLLVRFCGDDYLKPFGCLCNLAIFELYLLCNQTDQRLFCVLFVESYQEVQPRVSYKNKKRSAQIGLKIRKGERKYVS